MHATIFLEKIRKIIMVNHPLFTILSYFFEMLLMIFLAMGYASLGEDCI